MSTSADLMRLTKTQTADATTAPQRGILFFLSAIKGEFFPISLQCENLMLLQVSYCMCSVLV